MHDAYYKIIILDFAKVSNLIILYDVKLDLQISSKPSAKNRIQTIKTPQTVPWCYKGTSEEVHTNGKNVEYIEPLDHTQHHKMYSQELNLKMRCNNPRRVYTASYKNPRTVYSNLCECRKRCKGQTGRKHQNHQNKWNIKMREITK
jgi:hypothetical protein